MKKLLSLSTLAAASACLYGQTWTGATDANWDTETNWTGGVPNSTGASVVFNSGSANLNVNVATDITIGDISWNTTPSDLTLSGTGVITFDDGTDSNNFLYTTNPAGSNLTINNDAVFTAGQSNLINFNSRATVTLNGDISGVAGIRKTGAGSLVLTGTNSYTGTTRIDANILQVESSASVGTGTIQWNAGGGSAANFQIQTSSSFDNALYFRDAGGAGSTRIRSVGGVTSTFTTNSITADAGEVMTLLRATGGTATTRFTGTSLTTDVTVAMGSTGEVMEVAPASGSQTWSGDISGTGSVQKSGAGSVTLSGDNSYTGTTAVDEGTLFVDGTTTGLGAFTVATGAILGGSGTIATDNANVTIDGSLSAGNSPGTLSMDLGTGTLDITNAESLIFELGTTSDLILLTSGTLTIDSLGFSDFSFSDAGDLIAGDYTLFDTSSTIGGTLDEADLSGTFGSFNGTLSFANSNQDIILTVSAVPEPSAYALIVGMLAIGIAAVRRR